METKAKKYPKAVVGVFIFNEKDELFLMRSPHFYNKYSTPGGKIEMNEAAAKAAEREVKEETNLKISDIEFVGLFDALNIKKIYKSGDNHLLCCIYRAKAKSTDKVVLNSEGTAYKWRKASEWLKNKDLNKITEKVLKKYFQDRESYEMKYKRALADYQNLLKRTAMEREEFVKFSQEQFIHEILPVYNNLKLSLDHIEDNGQNPWVEGIKYVFKNFTETLESMGLQEIKVKPGDKFDHNIMDAIEGKGECVERVVEPGYKFKGRVMKAVRVVVKK